MGQTGGTDATIARPRRRWRRGCLVAGLLPLALGTGWAVAAFGLDRYGCRETPDGRFDAIIVLGCKVERGGIPSLALYERTSAAAELWREGKAPLLILTGGVGANPPAEAEVEATAARRLGVPEEAMVIENRSTSTEENAAFAARLTTGRRVIVVTDTYHVFRAERVFRRYFAEVHGVGRPPLFAWRVRGSLREVGAVVWYGLRGRL